MMTSVITASFILIVIVVLFFIYGVVYVLDSVGKMKCMQKVGEKAWKAWIPFYSDYIMYQIVDLNKYLVIVKILQLVLLVINIGVTLFANTINLKNDIMDYGNYSNSSYSSNIITYKEPNKKNNVNSIVKQSEYAGIKILDSMIYLLRWMFSVGMFVVNIFFAIKICKAFNLNGGYIAGMILLPGIFLLVIGFGKSEYVGKYVAQN